MKQHHHYILAFGILGFAILVFIYYMYLLFWPFKPFTVNTLPIKVETKIVERGGNLVYVSDLCRHTDAPTLTFRFFEDGLYYAMPPISAIPNSGTCGKYRFSLTVPTSLPPGRYRLIIRPITQVNPVRSITQEFATEFFEVR